MSRIGIFGSSFNPLHVGHLIMAEQAMERLLLDKVLLVPTKSPYHKRSQMLDFDKRYNMAVIEADLNDRIEVSDVEEKIEGNSYTFDVINLLKTEYPDSDFFFIMGSDSLIGFEKWYKADELLSMASFVVFQRPEDESVDGLVDDYKDKGMDIHYFNDLQIEISSTYIRNCLKEKKSVKYLLTEGVINYIKENDLYE